MAQVPNTDTFSLQDVVDVVNPATDSLQSCFDHAIYGYFDPAYRGDGDRLSNFRNYTESTPTDVEITSVGTIADGIEYDRMNVTVNFTNSGDAGNATVYWEIRDSGSSTVDSGSQLTSFATGSGSRALTGLTYPAAGNNYTLRAKETDDASWEVSNSFNVTP